MSETFEFCNRCGKNKPVAMFRSKSGKRKYANCQECRRDYGREHMRRKRGITHEQIWDILIQSYDSTCARCGYFEFKEALELVPMSGIRAPLANSVNRFVYGATVGAWNNLLENLAHHCLVCTNCSKGLRAGKWSFADYDGVVFGTVRMPEMPTFQDQEKSHQTQSLHPVE